MFLIPIRVGAPLALTAAFGCTLRIPQDPTEADTTGTDTTGTSGETPTTSESASATTGDPTSESGTSETGPSPPLWCNGFDPLLGEFTVHNNKDESIVNGSTLAAECGGQGTLMIAVFPHFGGFMPAGDSVSFDVTLDVEGFNLGPDGHFFSVMGRGHTVDCAVEETGYGGYSYSFIPMFPPDGIADINVIDGKPGHLHLTLHTPDGEVPFDADVVMSAAIDQCGYGYG